MQIFEVIKILNISMKVSKILIFNVTPVANVMNKCHTSPAFLSLTSFKF